MDSQAWLVFWGAFGGAAAAGIFTLIAVLGAEWFKWYIDRPLLKVKTMAGSIIGPGDPGDGSRKLFIEMINA